MVRHYVPTGRPRGRPKKSSPGNPPPEISPVNSEPGHKKTKKVNPRHLIAAKAILQGKSTTQAVIEAGYNPTSMHPRMVANDLARRALVKAGGTLTKIAGRHVEALDAMETKFFQHEGVVVDQRDVVAHDIRLRAVDTGYKLHGAYPKDDDAGPRKGEGPTVLIEFVSRQATQQTQTQQQTTIAIDFARKGDGNGHNGGGA